MIEKEKKNARAVNLNRSISSLFSIGLNMQERRSLKNVFARAKRRDLENRSRVFHKKRQRVQREIACARVLFLSISRRAARTPRGRFRFRLRALSRQRARLLYIYNVFTKRLLSLSLLNNNNSNNKYTGLEL